jgi:hypothetical protein
MSGNGSRRGAGGGRGGRGTKRRERKELGKATNGVTLVEPSGTPEVFERTVDFGTVRVGKLVTQNLVFRNDGRSGAAITSAQLVTQSPDYYLAGVSPLPTLEPGTTWQVVLRYLPSDVGDDTADVVVETDVADTAKYTVHFKGKGARSRVDVCTDVGGSEKCFSNTPEGLVVDLGEARPGESRLHSIVIKNSGDAPAGITHVATTDATSFLCRLIAATPHTNPQNSAPPKAVQMMHSTLTSGVRRSRAAS